VRDGPGVLNSYSATTVSSRFDRGACRLSAALFAVALGACASPPPTTPDQESRYYTFERAAEGSLPESFVAGVSGAEPPGRWEVAMVDQAAEGRRALVQHVSGGSPERRTAAWLRKSNLADLSLVVQGRAVDADGKPNPAAPVGLGLAWHVRDAQHFLAFSLADGERGARVEVISEGSVRLLGSAPFIAEPGRWYRLTVEQVGGEFRCGVDGRILLEGSVPDAYRSGSVGVCTLGNACAQFDQLTVVGAK